MYQRKMIGKTAFQCPWGCCRGSAHSGYTKERRTLKRVERTLWKKELVS